MSDEITPKRPYTIIDSRITPDGLQRTVIVDGEIVEVPPITEAQYQMLRELTDKIAEPDQ